MSQVYRFLGEKRLGLYTPAQIKYFDRLAVEQLGMEGFALMCEAAAIALQATLERWPDIEEIYCLCGKGNNGGDGLVFAALAARQGIDVHVALLAQLSDMSADALRALSLAESERVDFLSLDQLEFIPENVVLVDAILGLGQTRPPEDYLLNLIQIVNQSPNIVVALDVPTGLCGRTGQLLGQEAIKSDLTVTFIAAKRGLFTELGRVCCPDVVIADLDIPKRVFDQNPSAYLVDDVLMDYWLLPRPSNSHKGSSGRVAVLGGNQQYPGAALMSSRAALRAGAGLIKVVSHPQHVYFYPIAQPELMSVAFDTNVSVVDALEGFADVAAIGPGLGRDSWARQLLNASISLTCPVVLDADALYFVAQEKISPALYAHCVITPHPGEAAMLLGTSVVAVQNNRFLAAAQLAQKYQCNVVMKGPGTIVAFPEREPVLVPTGNAGLAVGGSGDVLTGVIASFVAQGVPFDEACILGPYIHGKAADSAAGRLGQRGLLPSDVIDQLQFEVNP